MEEKDFTQIELHLQNRLPATDRQAFEKRAATDPEFADELAFQTEVAAAVRHSEFARLKNLLREEDRQMLAENPASQKKEGRIVTSPFGRRWAAAAAAAVFVLAFGGWWLFLRETPERLFAQNFEAYPNVLADKYGSLKTRGGPKPSNPVDEAFWNLEAKNYALASDQFADLADEKKDADLTFWQGQALAADGKKEEAVRILEPFATNSESMFYGAAHWYLALAFLNADDVPNAKIWLEKITTDPLAAERKKEATALLKKLD